MIAWLLGPVGRWLIAAAVTAAGLWWGAHTVSQWRAAYLERPALVAARDQAIAAQHRSETETARQVAVNQEVERELMARYAAADGLARDLARRLLQAGRPARPVCPAPAAPSSDDGAGGEPDDGGALEAAVGDHLAACDRDAARLTGLQAYVRGLPARCVPD